MADNTKQIDRLAALLRDVERSGGKDRWSHLHSHGHSYSTVRSAVLRGYMQEATAFEYSLTDKASDFFVWFGEWKRAAGAR